MIIDFLCLVGVQNEGNTLYVNASTCTYRYKPLNAAVVIDLPFDRSQPARVVSVGRNIDQA